jgi:hypothetical protein
MGVRAYQGGTMMKKLASVLVLLAVAGAGRCGEKDIIERLEKAGARVTRGYYGGLMVVLDCEHSDADLAELCELPTLECLSLSGRGVTDADMRTVGGLKRLECLLLCNTSVTEAGLRELKRLPRLEQLALTGKQTTDVGLKEVGGLTNLKSLALLQCEAVTDAGLDSLSRHKRLRKVVLVGTGVTAEGFVRLKRALPDCAIHDDLNSL